MLIVTFMAMKDIASAAGVSVMTVSRALRQDPKVSPALQQKIQRIADRLGYRPHPLVSALMSSRRSGKPLRYDLKLGFITAFPTRDGWKKFRLYREFYAGAERSAEAHGYQLEEFWLTEPGMNPSRMSQVLLTRNIRGLLLAPLPAPQGRMDLVWEHFSAVAFAYSVAEPALHRIANNHFRSMRLLLTKLRQMGYERPGLALAQSLDDRVLHQWFGGFVVEQQNFPRRRLPFLLIPDQKWNHQRLTQWLERHQPDIIIGQQQELLEWIEQSGLRVPRDVGFAHLDCPAVDGLLSGIYQNGPAVGLAAADTLIAMLNRNERGVPVLPHTLLIEGSWAQGSTTRKAQTHSAGY